MPITARDLLELAEGAVCPHETLDQDIESLALYSEAFSGWQVDGMPAGKAGKSELKKLNSLHARIIKRAEEIQDEAKRSLADFRRKTKGLKAYLATGPVSPKRPRSRKG